MAEGSGIEKEKDHINDTSDEKWSTYSVACEGHLFVYSTDGTRFMIPIEYLSSSIFRVLLRMSEKEFGLPSS